MDDDLATLALPDDLGQLDEVGQAVVTNFYEELQDVLDSAANEALGDATFAGINAHLVDVGEMFFAGVREHYPAAA